MVIKEIKRKKKPAEARILSRFAPKLLNLVKDEFFMIILLMF